MNDLNGRILPDTSTGLPSVAHELEANAELNRLRTRLSTLEDENRILKAENAELREKCMTRFARIKNAENPAEMAALLHKIYLTGASDYIHGRSWNDLDDVEDMGTWLQEIGKI